MQYKIEAIYIYGWDDACWTEETQGTTRPLRFQSVARAQGELNKFFAAVKCAVAAGNMDTEENPGHYRIVAIKK